MGEVYKARDTRLRRDVALKVLPQSVAADADRLARFEREAQTLAALNHSHIAAIYGLEESDGTCALVMELVEGPTLADRIAQGPLPLDEALPVACQIAEALEAAHEAGIIHRDLKPANIKLRPDGTVKVLDFGLAKTMEPAVPAGTPANSPTVTSPALMTHAGVILGTAAYMSPEQARGHSVDRRTDIWAFGCVLFEMLTGRSAFEGTTTVDVLSAVIQRQPQFSLLPRTPTNLERLLRRCLEKDRTRRLRDIGDALLELQDELSHERESGDRRTSPWRLAAPALFGLLGALTGAFTAYQLTGPPPEPLGLRRATLSISLPPDDVLANLDHPALALSPDGGRVVFVAGSPTPRLFVRDIAESDARPLAGTERAASPFFSPDGRSIAFFADGQVKKVAIEGGETVTVCGVAGNPRGGSWSVNGTIAFTPAPGSAILEVSADGGTPKPLTKLDQQRGEGAHHWPEFMPDGKAILYVVGAGTAASWDDRDIVVESLVTHERQVVAHGSAARYAASGHLLVARGGAVTAQPFDSQRLRTTGSPARLVTGVMQSPFGAAQFAAARNGSFVYVAGGNNDRELVWLSRSGIATPLAAPPQTYWSVRVSPEGKRLALGVEGASYGVSTYDLERETPTRLTLEGTAAYPIWTPDGARLTFNSTKDGGVLNLFWQPADGSGDQERLATSEAVQIPNGWSPDGRLLLYSQAGAETGRDVWLLSRDRPGEPSKYLGTKFDEGGATFSPDGRWIAYVSTEAGAPNVYVRSFTGPSEKIRVSQDGGGGPVWARTGRELFFRSRGQLFAVDVTTGTRLQLSKPRLLFETRLLPTPFPFQADYDVAPDGQRFVMIRPRGEQPLVRQLELVIGAVKP